VAGLHRVGVFSSEAGLRRTVVRLARYAPESVDALLLPLLSAGLVGASDARSSAGLLQMAASAYVSLFANNLPLRTLNRCLSASSSRFALVGGTVSAVGPLDCGELDLQRSSQLRALLARLSRPFALGGERRELRVGRLRDADLCRTFRLKSSFDLALFGWEWSRLCGLLLFVGDADLCRSIRPSSRKGWDLCRDPSFSVFSARGADLCLATLGHADLCRSFDALWR